MATKLKTSKPALPAGRGMRPHVICFRITDAQQNTLTEIWKRDPAGGVNSPKQLARKIVCD
jgi:hypothetical protein